MRHTFSVNGVIFMVFGKLLFKRFVFQACHVKITFLLRCLLKNVSERVTFTPRHRGLEPWLLLAASLIDGSGLRMTHSLRQPRWLCASGIGRSFQFSNHLVAQMLSWLTFLGKGSFSTILFWHLLAMLFFISYSVVFWHRNQSALVCFPYPVDLLFDLLKGG